MDSDALNLIFVMLLLVLIIFVFVRIALKLRKHGGSMTTTMFASTYEFLGKDHRKAVEEIVEQKAEKKIDEETFGDSRKIK